MDKASRAMERARRAQKGGRALGVGVGVDPLDEEEGYPHYDIESHDGECLYFGGGGNGGG